ncbi:hypothetical protein R6Q59_037161 [Mikania micrantha]
MTPKMVARFRRSVSFSNTAPPPPSSTATKTAGKRVHFRSTSLPTRSHPILFQLKYHLNQLKFHWASDALSKSFDSDRVSDALVRLRIILESLDDLLDQTLSRDSLHRHRDWVEKVLEDFLVLVDVYGTFQMQVSTLKQCIINAQLATKRKDMLKKIACVNGMKKSGGEISKLVPFLQEIRLRLNDATGSHDDLEIVGAIKDVIEVIIMTSESIFSGIYGSFETRKTSWLMVLKKSKTGKGIKEVENGIWSLRNYRNEDLNKKMMQEMEECIEGIEGGSERVFRSLINTRVSLLNVLTQ